MNEQPDADEHSGGSPGEQSAETPPIRTTKVKGGNPFKNGFKPTGQRSKQGKSQSYLTKKSLLKHMLEVDITVGDLPTEMADQIRSKLPGFLENVERKFTIRQVMELVQLQLLFSKSDYVKQDAITAIKDRTEGKPMQKVQVENLEAEPTEFVLTNGRRLVI